MNYLSPTPPVLSFLLSDFLRSPSPPPPLPSSALLSSNFHSCALGLRHTPAPPLPPLLASSFLARPTVSVLPSRRGSSDDSGDARPAPSPGLRRRRNTGIIITISVIISQMRRAKLELCPSPSGWLTVTNSSLIHSTHQLYTGQRSPERQEAAKASLHVSSPTAAQRHITALCAQPLSPVSSFSLSESRRQLVITPLAKRCNVRMSRISS